jgi:hypothetical protein
MSADDWTLRCCICNAEFTGGGHNPHGYRSKFPSSKYGQRAGRCCGKCNVHVEVRRGEKWEK